MPAAAAQIDIKKRIADELPRLRRYARALLKNPDRADDLVQDTIVRALAKSHLWQPDTDLRAWLFTLMHNQYVNFVRKSVREGSHCSIEAAYDLGKPASQTDNLMLRDFKRALDALPVEQRSVVLLIGLEGMKYEDVADVLQVPVGTVRSRLSRAREAMRHLMDAPERQSTTAKQRERADAARQRASIGAASPDAFA
jgi:RNA polymerase sigma-70 factor, ECF subfamily